MSSTGTTERTAGMITNRPSSNFIIEGSGIRTSSGLLAGWKVAAVFHARVIIRPVVGNRAARMLPRLAVVVPMKTKFGQSSSDLARLLLREGNPNPLPNHFRQLVKLGCFLLQQLQQRHRFQLPIRAAQRQVNFGSVHSARLFGTALEL